MILTHHIRLDLNNAQTTLFGRFAGTARFAYNWGLAHWQKMYTAGEKPSWQVLNAKLNSIKGVEFPWMREVSCWVPLNALADLGFAFSNFFRRLKAKTRKPGFPRFKKKGRCRESFCIVGCDLRFDGRRLYVPKLGWVRMCEALRFPGKALSTRFVKRADHWYASIRVEVADSWSYPHACETQAAVGIDVGVVDLAVLSTGERVKAPRALRRLEAKLRRLDKELHRRRNSGKNRAKTKMKLARLHERIANVRKDVTHKLTADLVRRFRWIAVEDLNVTGMLKNHRLAKSIADAAMAEVRRQLDYKSALSGSTIVEADRWFPSSKTCSACGVVLDSLPLGVREWTCPACGAVHDRDVNAAKNLKKLALAQRATACCQGGAGLDLAVETKLPRGQESSSVANFG